MRLRSKEATALRRNPYIIVVWHLAFIAPLLNAADDGFLRYPKTVNVPKSISSTKEHQTAYRHGYYLGWHDCLQVFYFEGKKVFFTGMGWNPRFGGVYRGKPPLACEFLGRLKGFDDCSRIIKCKLSRRSLKELQAISLASYFPTTWKSLDPKELAKAKSSFARRESPSRRRHIPPRLPTPREIEKEEAQRAFNAAVVTKEKILLEFQVDPRDPDWERIKQSFQRRCVEFRRIGDTMCAYGDQDVIDELRKQLGQGKKNSMIP